MIQINVLEDESLQASINKFASSLLPHKSYNEDYYLTNLNTVLGYVELDEMTMEYNMLFSALTNYAKLKVSYDSFVPMLRRETFDHLVEASVADAIMRPDIGIKEILEEEGIDTDLRSETTKEKACQILWERSMELYDTCYDLEIPSDEAMNYEPELRESFKAAASQQSINTQVMIIRGNVRIGRRRFSGFDGWREYSGIMLAEVEARLNNTDNTNTVILNDMQTSLSLVKSLQAYYEPIANWGIPDLDDYTPMLRHTLAVIVGRENIGKTKFAVNAAVQAILAGKKVAYMCGETEQAVVYGDIIINYVFWKFGVKIRPVDVSNPEDAPDEIHRLIGIAMDTIVTGELLVLQESFSYNSCYDEINSLYERTKFDVLFIDHSCALTGTAGDGSLKAKVDKLASDVKNFKKHHPVCIVVNSHPSTDAKEDAKRDRESINSPTKGSQDLSTDADFVYIIRDDETLKKQHLLKLETYKRRLAPRLLYPVILRTEFEVSAIIYKEELQAPDVELTNRQLQSLQDLDADLAEVEDGLIH